MNEESSFTVESAKIEFEKICEASEYQAEAEPDPELLKLAESPPPSNTVHTYNRFSINALKKIIKRHSELKKGRTSAEEGLKFLETELKFLERILYKNHNRFRNDRGYKSLRILQKSVMKLLQNFPVSALNNLSTLMPIGLPYTNGVEASSVLLPPTAIAQYAALQLWIVHLLLSRVEFCCRSAGIYALQRISLGHFWGVAAYQLSVVSRLWTLTCNIKKKVLRILSCLQELSAALPGRSLYTEEILEKIFELCPREPVKPEFTTLNDSQQEVDKLAVSTQSQDLGIGVKVRREDFEKFANPKAKVTKPEKKTVALDMNFLADLHSFDDLKQFIEKETSQRKSARKSAMTRRLNQDEWKLLKKNLLTGFNKKLPNKSIKKSRKIIRDALK